MSSRCNSWESVGDLEVGELKLLVLPEGLAKLEGILTVRDPSKVVLPVFKMLHEAAMADGLKKVVLDISALSFVNSSGIRTLVDWVLWLRDEPRDRCYALTFRTADKHAWQRASLPVLQSLAAGRVHIER